MSVTFKLSMPIETHGAKVAELTLREPTGKDIAACGIPRVLIRTATGSMTMTTDTNVVHNYISRLGNIPPSSANQLSLVDWMVAQDAVLGFFMPPEVLTPEAPMERQETADTTTT